MSKKKSSRRSRVHSQACSRSGESSRRSGSQTSHPDLWIAPRTSLSAQPDDLSWSVHPRRTTDARLLELADIALGMRKPQAFRKRRSLFLAEQSGK